MVDVSECCEERDVAECREEGLCGAEVLSASEVTVTVDMVGIGYYYWQGL